MELTATLRHQHSTKVATVEVTHPSPMPMTCAFERVYGLADVRRGASLQDIRLEVSVAHTKSRLCARFCVNMRRSDRSKWAFGIDIAQAKQTDTRMRRLVRLHTKPRHGLVHTKSANAPDEHDAASCPSCLQLRRELKRWPRFPVFSSVGKGHLEEKCAMLMRFFYRLFQLIATNAEWLQSCELLRELLRMTETMCRIQYDDDDAALRVIDSMKRVTPLIDEYVPRSYTMHHDGMDDDCSICLGSLYEPATLADEDDEAAGSSQPRQGVELPCGHRFHDTCICLWFHSRLNCPVCRTETTARPDAASPDHSD